jgi:glycine/D-amino acid oxidase-like deaminating enzyme
VAEIPSQLANHHDLRSGRSPWDGGGRPARRSLDRDLRCDVLVVGAGITGAMVAEHLTTLGTKVVIIDREKSGLGSTLASTAMLQWEIDRSLSELTDLYGFEAASGIYRKTFQAVKALKHHVAGLGLTCSFVPRMSLYIADGGGGGAKGLLAEQRLRERAGLPTLYLDYRTLLHDYGISREAALISLGSAEADPVCLAHQLLDVSIRRGARLYDGEAIAFDAARAGVAVQLRDGPVIEAAKVVLATGYVMPSFVHTDLDLPSASWALATSPQAPERLWPNGVLIWEDATPYAYLRTTTDNRIIIGGEDERGVIEPDARQAVTEIKTARLRQKLKSLFPGIEPAVDYAWSGAFSETCDGLPLIGPVPGWPSLFAAYGYGGNGITFSFLAARMLARMIDGGHEAWDEIVALDRPRPKSDAQ